MAGLLIINPNSTEAMTASILASARAAMPGHPIDAWTSKDGPPAIQGPEDGARAVPPLLKLIDQATGYDAIIIACFDDTGLAEAKTRAPVPVIGIGEAGYVTARLLGHRFSVVTTLPVSVPVLEGNIEATGFNDICARVRASNVPVLALEEDPEGSLNKVTAEAKTAIDEDGISAIVLGCAGMTGLQERIEALGVKAIDGVTAAVHLAKSAAVLKAS